MRDSCGYGSRERSLISTHLQNVPPGVWCLPVLPQGSRIDLEQRAVFNGIHDIAARAIEHFGKLRKTQRRSVEPAQIEVAHDLGFEALQKLELGIEVRNEEGLVLAPGTGTGSRTQILGSTTIATTTIEAVDRLAESRLVEIDRNGVHVVHGSNEILHARVVFPQKVLEARHVVARDVLRLQPDQQRDLLRVLRFQPVRLVQEARELEHEVCGLDPLLHRVGSWYERQQRGQGRHLLGVQVF
ncbi:unnamed protein product, partial [Mycena citricolor]